jgi:hypothetical protein
MSRLIPLQGESPSKLCRFLASHGVLVWRDCPPSTSWWTRLSKWIIEPSDPHRGELRDRNEVELTDRRRLFNGSLKRLLSRLAVFSSAAKSGEGHGVPQLGRVVIVVVLYSCWRVVLSPAS